MMQPIIENLIEVVKKGRRRELHFHDHGNIIDTFESQIRLPGIFTSNHLNRGLKAIHEKLSNHEADI